jgi:hypothetical protein
MSKDITIVNYLKLILISILFVIIIFLYLNNESNKAILGIIFDSFWINWLVVFYIFLIQKINNVSFSNHFYKIRKHEYSGFFYQKIGVKLFKKILVKNPLPLSTAKLSLKNKSIESIRKLENQMRVAETIHFISFVISIFVMLFFGLLRDLRFIYFMIIFNIIINLYPFFVQRYNRNRINKRLDLVNK